MTFEEAFEIVADFKMQHAKKIALLMTINPPKFDPNKLEERDKEKYFEAQKALEEIKARFPEEYSKTTSFRF